LIRKRIEARLHFFPRFGAVPRLLLLISIFDWGNWEEENLGPLTPVSHLQRALFAAFDKRIGSNNLTGPLGKLPRRVCDRATNLIENLLEIEGAEVTPEDQQPEDKSGIAYAINALVALWRS
jgi:hypothetical protein